jgi:hypothetical protein
MTQETWIVATADAEHLVPHNLGVLLQKQMVRQPGSGLVLEFYPIGSEVEIRLLVSSVISIGPA